MSLDQKDAPLSCSEDIYGMASPSINSPGVNDVQYEIIFRRQHSRTKYSGGLKITTTPSRFLNLSNDFEFAGWGTVSQLQLTPEDISIGKGAVEKQTDHPVLGDWMASAVAANDILGGVFYALPALVSVAGVYSPISILIATLTLFLWRPVLEDLTAALPMPGANYRYLINVTSKAVALGAAALALLDYTCTAVISAATTSAYISGEVSLPFPIFVGTILVATVPVAVSLCGLRESARTAFGILLFHGIIMLALIIASVVAWVRLGNDQLRDNWITGQPGSSAGIARQIFNGVCIGMLSLTGIECSPDYASVVRTGKFGKVLRNIHIPTILLNAPIMLMILAILPLDIINSGANVLSVLAEKAGGRWLRILVVIDACVVLSAGVLTGILSACALFEQLANDRVIPHVFTRRIPVTDAQVVAILSFVGISGILYASASGNAQVISDLFALTWLSIMALFPLSLLLMRFGRSRICKTTKAPLFIIFLTLIVSIVIFAGNIAIEPKTVEYFAIYAIALFFLFLLPHNKVRLLRWMYWSYDQSPFFHSWKFAHRQSEKLVRVLRRLRRQPLCLLIKSDEIHQLFQMITYVHVNEETSRIKLIHFYNSAQEIPSELEANAKLLDEAFPHITIDLILINSALTPITLAALAHKLQIPPSLMFISCPGPNLEFDIAQLGVRIISR